MEVSAAAILFLLAGFALLMASIWAWQLVALRIAISSGRLSSPLTARATSFLKALGVPIKPPLVPWSTRRAVPWGLIDLVLLLAVWVVASLVAEQVLRHFGFVRLGEKMENLALDQRKAVIVANMLISLGIVVVGLPLIALRTGTGLRDFGWSAAHVLDDLRLGCIAFVMLAPPVYGLQGLLVQLWKPSKHPLIEMFKGTPDPAFFVLLFVSAAWVAPLFEELIFRVVTQGYLEKWCSFNVTFRELLFGSDPSLPLPVGEGRGEGLMNGQTGQDRALNPVPAGQDETDLPPAPGPIDPNPYTSPLSAETEIIPATLADAPPEQRELRGQWAWLPILISSAIFALLHYSHGPDWIPLFLLAAGMGYLYQRTHRLLPSLIVHTLLNAFSLWGLWVQVQAGTG